MMRLRKRWEKIINEFNISTYGRKNIIVSAFVFGTNHM